MGNRVSYRDGILVYNMMGQMDFSAHLERWQKAKERQDQAKVAAIKQDIEEQRAQGRCDMTPMPRVATKPFRTELYTEAIPIFVCNSFAGKHWTWKREVVDPESNETIIDTVVVGKTSPDDEGRGVLKNVHQMCWYKLLHLWGQKGYPVSVHGSETWGQLTVSAYELVMMLRGDDSAYQYNRARQLLRDLSAIPIRRELVYPMSDEVDEAEFTLLYGVEWKGRSLNRTTRRPKPTGKSEVLITFSTFVTERFLNRRVKALMLQPYLNLTQTKGRSAEVAPLLYPKLDRELANKDEYHRRLEGLLAELGVRAYRHKSKRRLRIAPAIKALDGQPIQREEYTLRVELRLTIDESDYLLVARRQPTQKKIDSP